MIQRIQTVYLLLTSVISGVLIFVFNLWETIKQEIFVVDLFFREAITLKDLSEDEIIKVEKLINMIDEDDDVQNVYHNMKSDN